MASGAGGGRRLFEGASYLKISVERGQLFEGGD